MAKHTQPRHLWYTWCWVCGVDFQTSRLDAIFCGPTCRQKASRAIRDRRTLPGLVYPFRWGAKLGCRSKVYSPDNYPPAPSRRRKAAMLRTDRERDRRS